MSRSRKKALRKKKAQQTEKKFFKYAILATVGLLVLFFVIYQLSN